MAAFLRRSSASADVRAPSLGYSDHRGFLVTSMLNGGLLGAQAIVQLEEIWVLLFLQQIPAKMPDEPDAKIESPILPLTHLERGTSQ